MRKFVAASCLAGVMAGISCQASAEGLAIAPKVGLVTGVGADLVVKLSPKLNSRIGFSYLPINLDFDVDGVDYELDTDISGMSVLLDLYPFNNGFRVSGGLVRNLSDFKLSADKGQSTYELGSTVWMSDDLGLEGTINLQPIAPYFGIGWGNPVAKDKNLGWNVELGVLALGKPNLELVAKGHAVKQGTTAVIDVTTNSEFQAELSKQKADVQDELDNVVTVLPFISIGLSYQF